MCFPLLIPRFHILQEVAQMKAQLEKEKKELLEATNIEAAEKEKISKELGGIFTYHCFSALTLFRVSKFLVTRISV